MRLLEEEKLLVVLIQWLKDVMLLVFHLFGKYALSTCYTLGTSDELTEICALWELMFQWKETDSRDSKLQCLEGDEGCGKMRTNRAR